MWTEPQRRQNVQLWLCKTLEHVNKSIKAGSRSERRERWKETSEVAKMWPCSDDGCAHICISQNCAKCTQNILSSYRISAIPFKKIYVIFKIVCIYVYLWVSELFLSPFFVTMKRYHDQIYKRKHLNRACLQFQRKKP